MSARQLVVRLGATTAALPAGAVRRVARALPLAPLPGAKGALLGLVEFGGEPLPVFDLARLLAGDATPAAMAAPLGAPAVTVFAWVGGAHDRELVALAVDEVLDVTVLDAPPGAGETLRDGAAVRIVDLERLELGR